MEQNPAGVTAIRIGIMVRFDINTFGIGPILSHRRIRAVNAPFICIDTVGQNRLPMGQHRVMGGHVIHISAQFTVHPYGMIQFVCVRLPDEGLTAEGKKQGQ